MAVIKMLVPVWTSLGEKAVGETADVPMAEARQEIALGRAHWNPNVATQEFKNVVPSTIVSLDGGGLASMSSILLGSAKLNDQIEVFLTADGGEPRRYRVMAKGALVANAGSIISPPDYDAAANDKFLVQI